MATTTIATTTEQLAVKQILERQAKKDAKIAAQKLKQEEPWRERVKELMPKHMAEIKKLEDELKKEGDNFKKKEKLDNLRRATMGTEEEMLELIKLLA